MLRGPTRTGTRPLCTLIRGQRWKRVLLIRDQPRRLALLAAVLESVSCLHARDGR